jgi:hypothetical protein
VIDYWDMLSGVLFIIIGAYNVWLSRSTQFEVNPVTVLLSRLVGGVGRARVLTLVIGVFCLLLGVVEIIFGVTGSVRARQGRKRGFWVHGSRLPAGRKGIRKVGVFGLIGAYYT